MKVAGSLLLLWAVGCITATTTEEELQADIKIILQRADLKQRLVSYLRGTVKPPEISKDHLACPIPQTWFVTEREENHCRRDSDCGGALYKCCDWHDKKHCLSGIDMAPKPGACPKPSMFHDGCLADHVSCRYDSECPREDSKCCMNFGCGYNDCQGIREHLVCPTSHNFDAAESYTNCTRDTECGVTEKCCTVDSVTRCLEGVDTIPKPGFCPYPIEGLETSCQANRSSCDFDSECGGVNTKCCDSANCGYKECVDMNRDFSCPTLYVDTATPTNESSTCSQTNVTCEGFSVLCCPTAVDASNEKVYNCAQGILHTPKPGTCPPSHVLHDPNGECLTNYNGGCEFDADCWGEHKCCETACGYSECLQLHAPPPQSNLIKRVLDLLTGAE